MLIEIQGFEGISDPIQKIKDEKEQKDEIFKIKGSKTLLVHCTDGVRLVSMMLLEP